MTTRRRTVAVQAQPAQGEMVGRSCPICQVQILRGEPAIGCPACQLGHHDECWQANEGCGAYGCEHAPETIKPAVGTDEVAWHGEKSCPECREKIKAQALVCHHCKASFWTRDPISRQAWEKREYSGTELNKVRNGVIAVFIASTCGCLFPIMGLVTAMWIWGGAGPFPYARLPESLKILLKASFGASLGWGVLFIAVMGTGL